MSINDLQKAFEIIDNLKGHSFYTGSPSNSTLSEALSKLTTHLPRTYLDFVKKYGAGSFFGTEIYGFIDYNGGIDSIPDALWLNLKGMGDKWPSIYFIIAETGDGAYYALDTSTMNSNNECPVVMIEGMNFNNICYIAEDFGAFLLSQIEESKGI